MSKENNKKKRISTGAIVGIGAGIAALAGAAYAFLGPNKKKNRKIVSDLGKRVKKSVMEKAKEVKELTEPVYQEIVEQVKVEYENLKEMDPEELAGVILQIKESWDNIKEELDARKELKEIEEEEQEKKERKGFFGKRK